MMIPKVIHYCWFGNGAKSKEMKKCIQSWKMYFPGWEIREWNESTIDIEKLCDYAKEAYKAGKYAFVSDYVRIKVLAEYGGLYLDTDVEFLKNCEKLFENKEMVLGFQCEEDLLTAMIAAVPNHPMIKEFRDLYHGRHFIQPNGEYDSSAINAHFNVIAEKYGVDLKRNTYQEVTDRMVVYPSDFFCAFDMKRWHSIETENTYSIHHMASSWCTPKVRIKARIIKLCVCMLGRKRYDLIYSYIRKENRK